MKRGAHQPATSGRRLAGFVSFGLTTVLVAFHGHLLWERLADGSLLQPLVAAKWILSALLTLALLQVWSRGLPLLRGRRAAVLWLIVLLLHAGVPGGALPGAGSGMSALLILPAALLGLAVLNAALDRAPIVAGRGVRFPVLWRAVSRDLTGWSRALFSRPPPVPTPF